MLIVHLFVSYAHVNLCHLFLFLLVSRIGFGFCLWLFLDLSVYLYEADLSVVAGKSVWAGRFETDVGLHLFGFVGKSVWADTEAPFLDLHLSISNGFVSSKIYDKRDDFDFDIVNFSIFGW